MELRSMWKDPDSGVENCPALYKTDGGYVVQGKKLDENARAQLRQLGNDEDGVFVPDAVLDLLKGS